MRILLDYRPALRQRTGVGEFAHRLGAALVHELGPGDRLALFSSSWKDRLPAGAIAGAEVVDRRIPVRVLNALWHRAGWPPLERLAGAMDVAQSLHPLLLPARRAVRFITIHDLDFLDHPEHTTGEIRRDYAKLARTHAKRADGVLVPSTYTRSQVSSRLGVPAARVTVFPPFQALAPRPQPSPGGPILFIGTVEPRKNIAGLIAGYRRLAAQVPDAPRLVVAGRISRGAESLLRGDAGNGRVEHLGYVSDDERRRLYDSATLLVLPSYDEGFGIPVTEAMSAGVPVVVSNRGALPEVAGDAALVVDPDDHEGLAVAMRRVLCDPSLRDRMVAAGLERARAFDTAAAARQVIAAYRMAIERRRGAR